MDVIHAENIFTVESSVFEDLVQQNYGREYVFSADEKLTAGETRMYEGITGIVGWAEKMALMEFNRIGRYSHLARILLEDLCNRGIIEPGDYLIMSEEIEPADEVCEDTVTAGYDLVIFDFYDTLVQMDEEEWIPRKGIERLLWGLQKSGKTLAVCSDAGEDLIAERLGEYKDCFVGIYGHSDLVCEDEVQYKNLALICQETGIPEERTIFVGDNNEGLDQRSAEKYGINFIEVPRTMLTTEFDFVLDFIKAKLSGMESSRTPDVT